MSSGAGCPLGLRCGVLHPPADAGLACVPIGSTTQDGPCWVDGGLDSCATGLVCIQGVCQLACDRDTGEGCSSNRICVGHFVGTQRLGVCLPRCDPVSQSRLTDGAPACGSTDGGMGCFGSGSAFVCAQVLFPQNRTGVVPQSNFVNSCANGFTPVPTSTAMGAPVVCTPYCRPAPTNSALTLQPGGVPPYTCAAAGAPGAECRFEWWFTDLSASSSVGRCLNPATTTRVLEDGGAGPVPSCTTLSAIDTDGNNSPDYLEWGCGP